MKTNSRILCVFLCLSILLSSLCFGASALTADEQWRTYFTAYTEDGSAVYMAPGVDETQRNISWYSPLNAGTCKVVLGESPDLSDGRDFGGTYVQTPEGDRSNKVVLTGLEPGKTYYYKCVTSEGESSTASFSTLSGKNFTAMYVTDIHVSKDDENADNLMHESYTFSQVVEEANAKTPLDLIVSAGDQASRGYRSEYSALVASPLLRGIPFALCPGNHDRKGIAYKYFTNNPNEYRKARVHALISYDYAYVKGDVLFLVFDSNVASMTEHRNFVRSAVGQYPDVKWRVAVFHHDLYGARIPHRESENKLLRMIWSPLMDEFAFDLVLLGHSHYYTVSNAIFDNKTNEKLDLSDGSVITDPKGSIVMVSGSINRPRRLEDGEEPPLGENIAYDYLTEQPIYNLLDCRADSITVRSFELGADKPFHTFTVVKTTNTGGHPANGRDFYDGFVRIIADIYGWINETVTSARMRKNWNNFVGQ